MSSVVKSLSALQESSLFEMLSSAFVYRASFDNYSCEFVNIPVLCWYHHRKGHTDMMNININIINKKWNINCVTIWLFPLHTINLLVPYCYLYCSQKAVFSLCFNIFIYFLMMSQFIASSTPMLMSNVLVLIQPCCVCCVHQITCFADICNVTNIHWCDYYCSLNKHCQSVSSMQDVGKLLMSRRFHSFSTSLSTASFISIIVSTIKWWAKGTAIATLHFMMWCR